MSKKIIAMAALALQLAPQVYAGSGASMAAIDAALQALHPSSATWSTATNGTSGGIGPAVTLSDLQNSIATAPASVQPYSAAWSSILSATSFFNLTALLPTSALLSSFYAVTLQTTSSSLPRGPTITYNGPAASSAVCGLYDSQAQLLSPTYSVAAGTFANVLPPPMVVPGGGTVTRAYSAYPIFPSAVKPPVNGIYYMICAAYDAATAVAIGVPLAPDDFIITW